MQFNICGFSQKKLIEHNLSAQDAIVLRWFADFSVNAMASVTLDGIVFYWVSYDYLLAELPILKIQKKHLRTRLKKMADAGILLSVIVNRFTHRGKTFHGTFTFYTRGPKYLDLITSSQIGQDSAPLPKNQQGGCRKIGRGVAEKSATKDSSTKDSSTKDSFLPPFLDQSAPAGGLPEKIKNAMKGGKYYEAQ